MFEQGKRLSDSAIWQWQRDYFLSLPLDAWFQTVPSYVTSNPVIAAQYAELVRAYRQDHPDETITLLELGAGTGQFSHYFLQHLTAFPEFALEQTDWSYIMSDFAPQLLSFWRAHRAFFALC